MRFDELLESRNRAKTDESLLLFNTDTVVELEVGILFTFQSGFWTTCGGSLVSERCTAGNFRAP